MPNGPAGAARLSGSQQFQSLVRQLAPALVQRVRSQLAGGPSGQRNVTRNGIGPRRNTRNQRTLARGAAMRSLPKGPVQSKEERFRGGATSSQHFAPRGQGYYDAFASMPDSAILSNAVGPCTPVEGYARCIIPGSAGVVNLPYHPYPELTAHVTTNAKLVFFNVGSSGPQIATSYEIADYNGVAGVHGEAIAAGAFAELGPSDEPQNVPGLGVVSDPGVDSIPLRGSCRLRNITERFSVGGEVRVMRYNGGLNTTLGVTEFLDICDMMRDTKRATTFGADDLLTAHQINTYPADSIRSHKFLSDTTFVDAVLNPKFCTLIVLIDDFKSGPGQVNNTYSFNFVAQRAARFRPGSLLHHKAKLMPANPMIHHKLHQREASNPIASIVKGGVSAVGGLAGMAAATSYASGELGMLAKAAPFAAEMLPLLAL